MPAKNIEAIVAFCKRRGFIFQNSEIYGGLRGIYDYGPLGVELKNNLKAAWWKAMVHQRSDVEGLDSAIITHRMTLKHSGHEDTFTDPMVDCRNCQHRMRADHIINDKCDNCGSDSLTEPRPFNLMVKTNLGPIDDGSGLVYLRPETAQGIFTNFKNVLNVTSRKLPFGIAQIGKAFRNEVTPKNFIFRVREFEQMELEFFVQPGDDEMWHRKWIDTRFEWWIKQGLSRENLEIYYQPTDELSHYSKATADILYNFPHGKEELEGIANRTDFDLGSHSKYDAEVIPHAKVASNLDSNTKMHQGFFPFVIEPSAGLERGFLAVISEGFTEERLENDEIRTVLRLQKHLAPFKTAVIPLVRNNEKITSKAVDIANNLTQLGLGRIKYEAANVGKSYRRHDEIGTPICITVDFETFEGEKETVTVRHRDSMVQERVATVDLAGFVKDFYAE